MQDDSHSDTLQVCDGLIVVLWVVAAWFRLFVGDLSNDVNDSTLNSAFGKYPSYCKCKVVRDRLSLKVSTAQTI